MYSYRVEQAIRAASVLHKDQIRKGSMPFPFVTHLIATAFTLMDYTTDEDIVVAGLLHDTLEDTDYTFEELQEDFGARVADIVLTLTEQKQTPQGNPITWKERKLSYARQIKRGPEEALLVAAADKIHNFRTTVEDYADAHDRFYQDFGKNFDDRLEVYQVIATTINSHLKNPIVAEFNHVFDTYKEFLNEVKYAHDHRY